MVPDADKDEEWEWVHTPPHLHGQHMFSAAADPDDDAEEFLSREDDADAGSSAGLLTKNVTQTSESLSSNASSPILKHNLAVSVLAKEHMAALDALHGAASEWIEPQLVFAKEQGPYFEGYEVYEVVMYLQNLPKAKEALMSVLSDPVVCDAVIQSKAFQQLTCDEEERDFGVGSLDSISVRTPSSLYKQGKKAYKSLKQKVTTAVDIVLSLSGRHISERKVVDELDATAKSCIVLVAILVFVIIGKRSNEGLSFARSLV